MLQSSNNLTSIFHIAIIAVFLLSLSACGYKDAPFYGEDTPASDENVEFIIQNTYSENNESSDK